MLVAKKCYTACKTALSYKKKKACYVNFKKGFWGDFVGTILRFFFKRVGTADLYMNQAHILDYVTM